MAAAVFIKFSRLTVLLLFFITSLKAMFRLSQVFDLSPVDTSNKISTQRKLSQSYVFMKCWATEIGEEKGNPRDPRS